MGCGAGKRSAALLDGSSSASNDATPKSELPQTILVDEVEEDGAQDESVPCYWTNKKHADKKDFSGMVYVSQDHHPTFDELLKTSYLLKSTKDRPCPKTVEPCERQSMGCPCIRVDVEGNNAGVPGLPTGFCVRRVVRVEHSNMWEKYAQKRKAILESRHSEKLRRFDPPLMTTDIVGQAPAVFESTLGSLNECYLWHGTTIRTALSIAQKDFDMSLAGTGRGAMYGPGAYFAECCTKADEYSFDEPGGYYDGIRAMLLCRVVMGKMYYTTKFGQEDAYDQVKGGTCDSVLADLAKYRKTFREFVVYDADQIYPEYVILYQRIHKADNADVIREIATTPFHLELPVYWRNCHRVPKDDPFDEQCLLKSVTCDLLQRLITACAPKDVKVELKSARRIENTVLLNEYVAFKNKVRAYLTGDAVRPALVLSKPCLSVNNLDEVGGSVLTSKFLREDEGMSVEESISVGNLDAPLNEHWLWYGATKDEVRAMARRGLDIERGGNNPNFFRYGKGLYMSDTLEKTLDYAEDDEDGTKHIILCRVCCGEMFYTEEESLPDGETVAQNASKHSVLASPSKRGPREFILLENTQVYPEFVLQVISSISE